MKPIYRFAAMTILLLTASTQLFAQKSEEAAIKKVLQDETSMFFHKNYDGWEKTWVHDTAASVLHANANSYSQILGWNAIATEYKQDIAGLKVRTEDEIAPFLNKTDYHIYINGNMAIVSFKEGNKNPNTEMRTLVKQNGAWKILNLTMINNATYVMKNILGNMRTFAGKWVLDGKPTMEPSNSVELNSADFVLKLTPTGMEQLSSFVFTTDKGQSFAPPADHGYFIPDYNTNTISYMSVRVNRFGQTFTGTGKVTSEKMNSFTVTKMNPDKPSQIQSEYNVSLKNGKWHQEGKEYDENGKVIGTNTIELRRL